MNKISDCTANHHAGRITLAKKWSLEMEASEDHTIPAIKHRTLLEQHGSYKTGFGMSSENQTDLTLRL